MRKELLTYKPQKTYKHNASEVRFLLGGIGTGTISLDARGSLVDWEIFNKPAKGNKIYNSFFSIFARREGEAAIAKVLEAKRNPPYTQAHGYHSGTVEGLPHMDSSTLKGEYPFVWIDFEDDKLPVKVSLEAFTPFIPLNADQSGIPAAVFRYIVKNKSDKSVDVTIAGSFANAVGFDGFDAFDNMRVKEGTENEYMEQFGIRGLRFTSTGILPQAYNYGSMAVMTTDKSITVKPTWLEGRWWDGIQDFWNEFSKNGVLSEKSAYEGNIAESGPPGFATGTLGIHHTLKPGTEKVFEFVLAWHFPNRVKNWSQHIENLDDYQIIKNYYANLFPDAWAAGEYLLDNIVHLEKSTRDFHRALFTSTLPDYVLEAVSANLTVIRSNTCFRIEDGTFLAWEGCHDSVGSCEGTCTHVWNYAQTLAYLFPELERSARIVEFELETNDDGNMAFRTYQKLGMPRLDFHPAADGQMGAIVRLYREWKLSGDNTFIERLWDKAAKALDFAFTYWDSDGDFVLDSQQHNTYDIEFYGPNSLTNSMFFAALKAGIEMAQHMGDTVHAEKYRLALEQGSKRMDELLWNGEYYVQQIDDINQYRYQYGEGCLSDQVFGQLLAHVAGLGYILPYEHIKKAIESVYIYNFKTSFEEHESVQRTYALNDESGLILCSWPKGGRPRLPFVYSDEVWTGIEYQVAAHLIYEGFVEEGLTIVKAVRDRHDGYRRNPWDEVECGHHYARSLASWAVLLALYGFDADMTKGTMTFSPAINQDSFSCLWSTGKAWGIFTQKRDEKTGELIKDIETCGGIG